MRSPARPSSFFRARRRGFVLMEVIVSLTILGFAAAVCMRSFTQSIAASRIMEVQTQAQFFAQQLMHEFEIKPPDPGKKEGGFGDDYKNYSFFVEVSLVDPRYRRQDRNDGIEQFFALREVDLEIRYDDGVHKPMVPIKLSTAIVGFEKYSHATKESYGFYE